MNSPMYLEGLKSRRENDAADADEPPKDVKMEVIGLNVWYGDKHALKNVSLPIFEKRVTALIGPSGCGKTTLLRALNRTNEMIPSARMTGIVTFNGDDIYDKEIDPTTIRSRIGVVAQKPNPFAKSVYDNVAYGPRIHGTVQTRQEVDALVERCLHRVGLWDEVKDRLGDYGLDLSGGQQQRLCIARAIATQPDVILMDEPCSALDPHATAVIEDLIAELRRSFSIVIVTHNLQQAARVSDQTAFFHLGDLVEWGSTDTMFTAPTEKKTIDYISGRFG